MCGRFSLGATIRVGQLFDLPNWPETPPRYNIAPSQTVPAGIQNRETGTRLTTPPDAVLQPSHDRMPVFLPSRAYTVWLDPSIRDVEPIQSLLTPYAAKEMTATRSACA